MTISKDNLTRRRFFPLACAAAAEIGWTKSSFGQSALQYPAASAGTRTMTVWIDQRPSGGVPIPTDLTGLSYEMAQLYNPEFFSPRNTSLVSAFRGLSTNGVLRLGGHLSNITSWEGVGREDPKQLRGVRHGIEDYWEWPLVDPTVQRNKKGMITRQAIENLRGFLDAVNWRLIYGLNFACGSAARAADESAVVFSVMGDRLSALVVGNEPDDFGEDPFFRPKGYDFDQYFAEYENWVKTVRARVPRAPFAGPDTAGNIDTWVKEYGRCTKSDAVMLTSHFYAMGPASDPRMNAQRLLRRVNPSLEKQIAGARAASAAAGGTPYRMDEGNSCFGGGKDGVSNAYASARWAADYTLHVACAGFAGVNFHGGGTGYYTPIESSDKTIAAPRPMYYGMQFAQKLAGSIVAPYPLSTDADVTAYLGIQGEQRKLAVINKSSRALEIVLPPTSRRGKTSQRWVLSGPSLDAKEGVNFEKRDLASVASKQTIASHAAMILEIG